mmetsp:Transcript_29355/g.68340  ORF Transcript_29355/g.68340 Transcript_29355/m.68340 type:complete len:175 (-) Transcript_29355:157-681(-)
MMPRQTRRELSHLSPQQQQQQQLQAAAAARPAAKAATPQQTKDGKAAQPAAKAQPTLALGAEAGATRLTHAQSTLPVPRPAPPVVGKHPSKLRPGEENTITLASPLQVGPGPEPQQGDFWKQISELAAMHGLRQRQSLKPGDVAYKGTMQMDTPDVKAFVRDSSLNRLNAAAAG